MEAQDANERALVARFKQEYKQRQHVLTIVAYLLVTAATGLVITGIVFLVLSDAYFGHVSSLWWDYSVGGMVSLMSGAFSVVIGLCLLALSKQNTMVLYIQNKLRLHRLEDPDVLLKAVRDTKASVPVAEKVVIKDIVKVRCSYCKELVDLVEGKCPHCSASL